MRGLLSAPTVGVALGGAAGCAGGTAAQPTNAPTTKTPTTTFVSKSYGYSIALPGRSSDWSPSYALVAWTTDTIELGTPPFETFTSLKDARRYVVVARRPPTGATLAKWTSFVLSTTCSPPTSSASSKLSAASARTFSWPCADLNAIGISAIHGGRGYFMWVGSPKRDSGASDRSAFEAARSSFRFLGR